MLQLHCSLKICPSLGLANSHPWQTPLTDESCPTLQDPMDCSTLGFPDPHRLLEFAQVHVHWISDAVQPSHPVTLFSCLQSFPASGSFLMSWLFASGGQIIGISYSASVLPKSIQGWFPLRLTGLISSLSKGLSGVFCSTTVQKELCLLCCPALTTTHDYWKDHSLDSVVFCRQSDVFAF